MAKELPYFKFEPNAWDNGNIQICSREEKGLFMDLCSMYWSRLGDVPLKLAINKLCGGNATAFDSLIEENIFTIIDGSICIDFLNEQLQEFDNISKLNSKNAKEGWEKRRKTKGSSDRNATASIPQCENDAIREEERREDKIKEDKIIIGAKNEKRFSPPTVADITEYCFERENTVDAVRFFDHYTSNGWMVGKNKMKDWKAAVRTWEKTNLNNSTNGKSIISKAEQRAEAIKNF
jgi:hypothetical protein